ncbi:hypothetical protein GCM10010335_63250 [Streptomyces galbus]|nr:hypothetical protein GCM10010335_63250 [Streptomyces galbus]
MGVPAGRVDGGGGRAGDPDDEGGAECGGRDVPDGQATHGGSFRRWAGPEPTVEGVVTLRNRRIRSVTAVRVYHRWWRGGATRHPGPPAAPPFGAAAAARRSPRMPDCPRTRERPPSWRKGGRSTTNVS